MAAQCKRHKFEVRLEMRLGRVGNRAGFLTKGDPVGCPCVLTPDVAARLREIVADFANAVADVTAEALGGSRDGSVIDLNDPLADNPFRDERRN